MTAEAPIVVALGGNAIIRRGETGTIEQQVVRAREALEPVAELVAVLMEADALYRDWGTPHAERISRLSVAGAGGPEAQAVICGSDSLADALAGRAGTRIVRA